MLSSHGEVESFGNGIHSNAQAVPLPFLHEYSKHDSYAYSNSNHSILGSQGGALAVPRPLIGSALAVPRYSLNSVLGSPGIPKVSVGNVCREQIFAHGNLLSDNLLPKGAQNRSK